MNKNKLLAIIAATALSAPMVAMAAQDSFDINYNADDSISIHITGDINLTNDNGTDDGSGNITDVRGSTTFCVGRQGADVTTALGYTIEADSVNNSQLSNGVGGFLAYTLKYATEELSVPTTAYEDVDAKALVVGGLAVNNSDTTKISALGCTPDGIQNNGIIWANIAEGLAAADTGTYTDTVTLTVAPAS